MYGLYSRAAYDGARMVRIYKSLKPKFCSVAMCNNG